MSDLSAGEEFRIFYGPRGNGELLLNQVNKNSFIIVSKYSLNIEGVYLRG